MQKKLLLCVLATCSFAFSSQQPQKDAKKASQSDAKKVAEKEVAPKRDWYGVPDKTVPSLILPETCNKYRPYDYSEHFSHLTQTIRQQFWPALLTNSDQALQKLSSIEDLLKQQLEEQKQQRIEQARLYAAVQQLLGTPATSANAGAMPSPFGAPSSSSSDNSKV